MTYKRSATWSKPDDEGRDALVRSQYDAVAELTPDQVTSLFAGCSSALQRNASRVLDALGDFVRVGLDDLDAAADGVTSGAPSPRTASRTWTTTRCSSAFQPRGSHARIPLGRVRQAALGVRRGRLLRHVPVLRARDAQVQDHRAQEDQEELHWRVLQEVPDLHGVEESPGKDPVQPPGGRLGLPREPGTRRHASTRRSSPRHRRSHASGRPRSSRRRRTRGGSAAQESREDDEGSRSEAGSNAPSRCSRGVRGRDGRAAANHPEASAGSSARR